MYVCQKKAVEKMGKQEHSATSAAQDNNQCNNAVRRLNVLPGYFPTMKVGGNHYLQLSRTADKQQGH